MKKEKKFALIFDWGDTVMRDFPQYEGPMVTWPEVEAVVGISESLKILSTEYDLYIATNAAASGKQKVKQALKRVALDNYFMDIYTAHEIGCGKSDRRFFEHIQHDLSREADELIMIGDSYFNDILIPHQLGWNTYWYNPQFKPCPANFPVQNIEFFDMRHLHKFIRQALKEPLPSIEQCIAWLISYDASNNLLKHVQTVAGVAYLIAKWIAKAGRQVNPILAHRGGLIHDLGKIKALAPEESLNHADLGAKILNELEQPILANIAQRHLLGTISDPNLRAETWEEKIVYYADKIVEYSSIVPLDYRLERLKTRYPKYASAITNCTEEIKALEKVFCDILDLSNDDLIKKLEETFNQ
jgi:putative hydrolase of the HAD superfamily